MKKNSLLKAILIVFLAYVVLSWIIPAGVFTSGEFSEVGTNPVGILDIFIYPLITATSSIFVLTAIVLLLIGGFYGVLNKTGAYSKWLNGIAKKFKGNETFALILVTLFFTSVTSITGLTLPMFALVPFFAAVLMILGYNKFTSMLSTVGGILVGNMASIYGFDIVGYLSYLNQSAGINAGIGYRLLMFALYVSVLLIVVVKTAKLSKTQKEEIPLYEKNTDRKAKTAPLIAWFVIAFAVVFVGMINFSDVFGITLFSDIHTKITGFTINGYPLFEKLIGTVPAIGAWSNYELGLVLILGSIIIGKVYHLPFSEIIESFIGGSKKMVKVAIFTLIASIIFLLMNSNSDGYTFYATIANSILNLTEGFNVITLSVTSAVGSVLLNNFPYLLSALYYPVTELTNNYTLVGIVLQSIHGLVQLIAPTSVILVAGLTFFNVEYTDWLKKLWRLFLCLFAAFIIVLAVFAILT